MSIRFVLSILCLLTWRLTLGQCNCRDDAKFQTLRFNSPSEIGIMCCVEKESSLGFQTVNWCVANNTTDTLEVKFSKNYTLACGNTKSTNASFIIYARETKKGNNFSGEMTLWDGIDEKACSNRQRISNVAYNNLSIRNLSTEKRQQKTQNQQHSKQLDNSSVRQQATNDFDIQEKSNELARQKQSEINRIIQESEQRTASRKEAYNQISNSVSQIGDYLIAKVKRERVERLKQDSEREHERLVSEVKNGNGELETCSHCTGQGIQPCSYCDGKGGSSCYICQGAGNQSCYLCSGKGLQGNITCGNCRGTGTMKCTTCQGKGVIDCVHCSGIGYDNCQYCSGAGEILKYVTSWGNTNSQQATNSSFTGNAPAQSQTQTEIVNDLGNDWSSSDLLKMKEAKIALEKFGDTMAALQSYRDVSDSGKQNPIYSLKLALLYEISLKKYDEAINYYNQYLLKVPNDKFATDRIVELNYLKKRMLTNFDGAWRLKGDFDDLIFIKQNEKNVVIQFYDGHKFVGQLADDGTIRGKETFTYPRTIQYKGWSRGLCEPVVNNVWLEIKQGGNLLIRHSEKFKDYDFERSNLGRKPDCFKYFLTEKIEQSYFRE